MAYARYAGAKVSGKAKAKAAIKAEEEARLKKKAENEKKLKLIFGWGLAVLVVFVFIGIGKYIVNNRKKPVDLTFNTTEITVKKESVPVLLNVQAIVEGDPQVKVYPQVNGKFVKNALPEGAFVNKDDVIAYLDRDIVGSTFEPAPVKSQVSGYITKLYYHDKGASINPQSPVAEVGNDTDIKVVFNVGQDDLSRIKPGQKASITSAENPLLSLDAKVSSVPPVIDRDIMAGTVVVKAPNLGKKLKLGMTADVSIVTAVKDAIMIPERAILLGEETSFVFVKKDGFARQVMVKTGYKTGGLVEITSGLNPGDMLIVDGNFKLFDGAKLSDGTDSMEKEKNRPKVKKGK